MFLNFFLYGLTSGRFICSTMTLNQHGPTCTLSPKSTQQQCTKTSSHCWFKPRLWSECTLTHTLIGGWTKCALHPEWIMNLQWIIHIHPRCIKCVLLQAVLNNENVCINIYTFLLCTSTTAELKEKQQLKSQRGGIRMQANMYLDCMNIEWKVIIHIFFFIFIISFS